MRNLSSVALCALLLFVLFCFDHSTDIGYNDVVPKNGGRKAENVENANDLCHAYDIMQRTCALYVALRSSAWEGPIPFGADMNDSMVHWNKCPGGKMVACAKVPTADGDSVMTGIPWVYGE